MTSAELIEALTVGGPDELAAAIEALLADESHADAAHLALARYRLIRIGFELDDPDELERLKPLRERFFDVFGR